MLAKKVRAYLQHKESPYFSRVRLIVPVLPMIRLYAYMPCSFKLYLEPAEVKSNFPIFLKSVMLMYLLNI